MNILLTGGAACGKSVFGEMLAMREAEPRYYIATMRPFGEESMKKINRHRRLREGKGFVLVEQYTDIAGLSLPERGTAVLECLCNLTANEMFDENGNSRDPFDDILRGVRSLSKQCSNLIVVTNDVGSGGYDYGSGSQQYIEVLGRLNSALADSFDCIYELVCGISVAIKGCLR
jgi:adenosylcobinamide kinase / adenosylcobinamide-phosphate guanylyltransferase